MPCGGVQSPGRPRSMSFQTVAKKRPKFSQFQSKLPRGEGNMANGVMEKAKAGP